MAETRFVLAGAASAAIASASAAFAQAPEPAAPVFLRVPDVLDTTRVYPKQALVEEVSGRVTLRCRVAEGGALASCVIVAETPAGYGFGEAAMRLTPRYRLDPARSPAGGSVQFTLGFTTS